jgi:hypothetical protein
MLPVVTDVVGVTGAATFARYQVLQGCLSLVPEPQLRIWGPVASPAIREAMQVVVLPAHGGLDHVMKAIKPEVGGDQQPPPHRWVVPLDQGDLDLEERAARRGRAQSATKRPQRQLAQLHRLPIDEAYRAQLLQHLQCAARRGR